MKRDAGDEADAGVAAEFPPVNSGGLIEANCYWRFYSFTIIRFPPVNSGGLIEANTVPSIKTPPRKVSAGEFRRPH